MFTKSAVVVARQLSRGSVFGQKMVGAKKLSPVLASLVPEILARSIHSSAPLYKKKGGGGGGKTKSKDKKARGAGKGDEEEEEEDDEDAVVELPNPEDYGVKMDKRWVILMGPFL